VAAILKHHGIEAGGVPRRKPEPVVETPLYHVDDLVRAILGSEGNGNGH
jgi:hypothetical protein